MNSINKNMPSTLRKRGWRVFPNISPLYQTLSILSIGTGKIAERAGWL